MVTNLGKLRVISAFCFPTICTNHNQFCTVHSCSSEEKIENALI